MQAVLPPQSGEVHFLLCLHRQPSKLVSSPVKVTNPVITEAPVIVGTHAIPDVPAPGIIENPVSVETEETQVNIPAVCPMSRHYSSQSHGLSNSQLVHSSDPNHVQVSSDQGNMSHDGPAATDQQSVTSDQHSISSCPQRSHGSHEERGSSGTAPLEAGSADPNASLYNKLGGPEALEAAVDMFYDRVLEDERLKHFFNGTNMMRLVIKQVNNPEPGVAVAVAQVSILH